METEEIQNNSQNNKTWLGSSLSDICKGKGPWYFSVSPVTVSKYHAILYELPINLTEPPKPHITINPLHWDDSHVRMPYSQKNLFPLQEDGREVPKVRWNIIKESLSQPIRNSKELEEAIHSYNSNLPKFGALHYFFSEVLEPGEAHHFFRNLLRKIIHLALQLPEIVPGSFPLLKKDHNRSVSLSQLQIACLLANAFLCTFPWRKDMAISFPGINFTRLFSANFRENRKDSVSEKLKCLFHYFRRVTANSPLGAVTFERKFKPRGTMPRWDNTENNLGNTKIHIDSAGTIEDDGLGFLQVDFANKNVGGGVLGYGCVQEEIRFIICPELIISRLFVEQLGDQEAVIVTGVERYSAYSGYGNDFKWSGNFEDTVPYDGYGRKRTTVCIIDATRFNKPKDQYYPSAMLRDVNKAYVGFSTREKENIAPVATGNWGCGAFNGSSHLKALLQLMACAASGRDLVYYTFGNEDLRNDFYEMSLFLASHRITTTQLWRYLCGFAGQKIQEDKLYSFIQQSFFDSQKQPLIKKFFGVSFKKREISSASTSEKSQSDTPRDKPDTILNMSDALNDVHNLFEDDIISGTPPEDLNRSNKKTSRNRSKSTPEEIVQKLPKTNIIEIMDLIDGNANKSTANTMEEYPEEMAVSEQSSTSCLVEECDEINLDVSRKQVTLDSTVKSTSSNSVNELKTAKRKISDYFQKSFKSS